MKNLLLIILFSIITSSCVSTDEIFSSNKLKLDMSKSAFEDVFLNSSIFEDPLIPGSSSEFYSESEVEIIWGINKKIFYVFENVLEPVSCGLFMCNIGNGNLSSWHDSLTTARSTISKKLNIELGSPTSE